jgi:hypothetical protein
MKIVVDGIDQSLHPRIAALIRWFLQEEKRVTEHRDVRIEFDFHGSAFDARVRPPKDSYRVTKAGLLVPKN